MIHPDFGPLPLAPSLDIFAFLDEAYQKFYQDAIKQGIFPTTFPLFPKEPDMQLYQYAVVKPAQPNNDARLIVPPSEWALYPSAEAAKAAAIRQIPADEMPNFASSWVLVRPFC